MPPPSFPRTQVDRVQLLTNVSLSWFTRSGASAAHSLYESMHAQEWDEPGPAPMGFAVLGADQVVRVLSDPEHKIEHWWSSRAVGTSRRWRSQTC